MTSARTQPDLNSPALYRFLAESLPQFVWIGRADGALDYCNPHATRYLGLTAAQVQSGQWMDAVFPDDLPPLLEKRRISPLRHEAFEMEVRIRRASDRSYRWHLLRATPFDVDGEWRWLGTALDIDDSKRENRMHALLASIVDSSPDAVVGLDTNGCIISWNSAAESLFGFPAQEAIGRPSHVLNPQAGEERASDLLRRALAGERVEWHEAIERAHDAAQLTLHCTIGPIHCEARTVVGAFHTFRDVTGQRTVERNLSAANERLRLVQRAVKAGTWEIDVQTGMVYRSPELRDLYGLSADESLSPETDWTRFAHPEDADLVRRTIESAIENRTELRLQYRAQLAGETRRVTAIGSVLEGGGPPRMVGITIDTTEFQKAEEAMRQSARVDSIGRLAGGVAHDFNNLLAGILGGASFIADVIADNHPARPMLDLVIRSSERAAHLTQQLLAYAGKSNFLLRQSDITQTVQDTFPLLRGAVPPNIDLVVQTGWNLPVVEADANQIRETVLNLVTNAAEAIGEAEGTVWVRTGVDRLDRTAVERRALEPAPTPGTYVYLEVKDDGPGIEPSLQKRIFEPFFTTRFMGRGLGLSAVQGIVRGHNGAIEVRSEPGKGAAFRILFPVSAPAKSDGAATYADASGAAAGVLVIDDEEAVRNIVRACLERAGYRVLLAADGISGLECFRQKRDTISLVILDIGMPGMRGPEVYDELAKSGLDVPVIVTSGYPEGEALARIGANRVNGFLKKPFSVRELSGMVEKLTASR